MARLPSDITIRTRLEVDISPWQAIKLRISGAGYELAKGLRMKFEVEAARGELDRALQEEDDAAHGHRPLS
jgi:hypothetical protein